MSREEPEIARQAILEVIENQIKADDPPETAQTLPRLQGDGYSRDDAMKLIGAVLASEMFAVMNEGREYDHDEYAAALLALPRLPWE